MRKEPHESRDALRSNVKDEFDARGKKRSRKDAQGCMRVRKEKHEEEDRVLNI